MFLSHLITFYLNTRDIIIFKVLHFLFLTHQHLKHSFPSFLHKTHNLNVLPHSKFISSINAINISVNFTRDLITSCYATAVVSEPPRPSVVNSNSSFTPWKPATTKTSLSLNSLLNVSGLISAIRLLNDDLLF